MSLKGGSLICLNDHHNKKLNKKILKPKGKSFRVGENFSCDYVYDDKKCKKDSGVYFEIFADAFGKVTIINHLKLNPIIVNGYIVKNRRPLRDGSSIKVFDKEFIWKFSSNSNSKKNCIKNSSKVIQQNQNDIDIQNIDKINKILKVQKSDSYSDKITNNQCSQMKRCTVHSFFQWINPMQSSSLVVLDASSYDKTVVHEEDKSTKLSKKDIEKVTITVADNTEIELNCEKEDNKNEIIMESKANSTNHNENYIDTTTSTTPKTINSSTMNDSSCRNNDDKNQQKLSVVTVSNYGAKLLPTNNLLNISDKENEIPDVRLSKCRVSDILFTTYTPNKLQMMMNKKNLNNSESTTPKSQYSTPKSSIKILKSNLSINENNSQNLIDFSTPQANFSKSSMHFTDLITPIKSSQTTSIKKNQKKSTLLKSAIKNSAKSILKRNNNVSVVKMNESMNSSLNNTSNANNNEKLIKGRQVFRELNLSEKEKTDMIISNVEKTKSKSFIELNSTSVVETTSTSSVIIDAVDHTNISLDATENVIEISSDASSINESNSSLVQKESNASIQKSTIKSMKSVEGDEMNLNTSNATINEEQQKQQQQQQQKSIKIRSIRKGSSTDKVSFVKKISPEKIQLFMNDNDATSSVLSRTKNDLSGRNPCSSLIAAKSSAIKTNSFSSKLSQPKLSVSVNNLKQTTTTTANYAVLRRSQSESKSVSSSLARQKTTLKRLQHVPNSAKASSLSVSTVGSATTNSLKRRLDYAAGLTKFTKNSIKKTESRQVKSIADNLKKNDPLSNKKDILSKSVSSIKTKLPIKAQNTTLPKTVSHTKIKTERHTTIFKTENDEIVAKKEENDSKKIPKIVVETLPKVEEKIHQVDVNNQNQEKVIDKKVQNTLENTGEQQQQQSEIKIKFEHSLMCENITVTSNDKNVDANKSDDLLENSVQQQIKESTHSEMMKNSLVEHQQNENELNQTFRIENDQQSDKNETVTEILNRTFDKTNDNENNENEKSKNDGNRDENKECLCKDFVDANLSKSEIFSERLMMENSMSSSTSLSSSPLLLLINNREDSVINCESESEMIDDVFKTPSAKMLMIPAPKSANVIQIIEDKEDRDEEVDMKEENISEFYDINDYVENLDDVFQDIDTSNNFTNVHNNDNDNNDDDDVVDEKEVTMENLITKTNTSIKSTDPLNMNETFDNLVGNPIIRKRYTNNSKKNASKYSNYSDVNESLQQSDENFPKTDIEEWIDSIHNYSNLMSDDKSVAEDDNQMDNIPSVSVHEIIEQQQQQQIQRENEEKEGEENMSGIDLLVNDENETNKSLFSDHLIYSETDTDASLIFVEEASDSRTSLNRSRKASNESMENQNDDKSCGSKLVKELNVSSFANFESTPKIDEKIRGRSMMMMTASTQKKVNRIQRLTVYSKPLNSSFDVNREKVEYEKRDAFKNFDRDSKITTLKKSKSSDNLLEQQLKFELEILSKTIYDKPLDSSFDLQKEKNLYEINAAFANFSEQPTHSRDKEKSFAIITESTKSQDLKASRLTVGQKPLDDSFDLQKEKNVYEINAAFANFSEQPTHSRDKEKSFAIITESTKRQDLKASRLTVGQKPLDDSFDLQKEKNVYEINAAFANFSEQPTHSRDKEKSFAIITESTKRQDLKASRLTVGQKPLDDSFDLQKEKNVYEINAAFANFSERPTHSRDKEKSFAIITESTKRQDLKASRLTVGQKPLDDSFDLQKEKNVYELKDVLQGMPLEPKVVSVRSKSISLPLLSSNDISMKELQKFNKSMQEGKIENLNIEKIKDALEKEVEFKNFEDVPKISSRNYCEKSMVLPSSSCSFKNLNESKTTRKTLGHEPNKKSHFNVEIEKLRYEKEVEFKNFNCYPDLKKLKAKSLSMGNIPSTSQSSQEFHSFDHYKELEREVIFLKKSFKENNKTLQEQRHEQSDKKDTVTATVDSTLDQAEMKSPRKDVNSEKNKPTENENEESMLNAGNTLINEHINEILITKSQSTPIGAGQSQKPKDVFLTPVSTVKRIPKSRKKEITGNDSCNESSMVGFDSFLTPLRRSQRKRGKPNQQDDLMNQMNSTSIFTSTVINILEMSSAKKASTTRSGKKAKIETEIIEQAAISLEASTNVSTAKSRRGRKPKQQQQQLQQEQIDVEKDTKETVEVKVEASISNQKPHRGQKLLKDLEIEIEKKETPKVDNAVSSTRTRRGKKQEEVKAESNELNEIAEVKVNASVPTMKSRRGKNQKAEVEENEVKGNSEKNETASTQMSSTIPNMRTQKGKKQEEDEKTENEAKDTTTTEIDIPVSNKKSQRGKKQQVEAKVDDKKIEDREAAAEDDTLVLNTRKRRGRKQKDSKDTDNEAKKIEIVGEETSVSCANPQIKEKKENVKTEPSPSIKVETESDVIVTPEVKQMDTVKVDPDEVKKSTRRGGRRKQKEDLEVKIIEASPLEKVETESDVTVTPEVKQVDTVKVDSDEVKKSTRRGGRRKQKEDLEVKIIEASPLEKVETESDVTVTPEVKQVDTVKVDQDEVKKTSGRGGRRKQKEELEVKIIEASPLEKVETESDVTVTPEVKQVDTVKVDQDEVKKTSGRGGRRKQKEELEVKIIEASPLKKVETESDVTKTAEVKQMDAVKVDSNEMKKSSGRGGRRKQKENLEVKLEKDESKKQENNLIGNEICVDADEDFKVEGNEVTKENNKNITPKDTHKDKKSLKETADKTIRTTRKRKAYAKIEENIEMELSNDTDKGNEEDQDNLSSKPSKIDKKSSAEKESIKSIRTTRKKVVIKGPEIKENNEDHEKALPKSSETETEENLSVKTVTTRTTRKKKSPDSIDQKEIEKSEKSSQKLSETEEKLSVKNTEPIKTIRTSRKRKNHDSVESDDEKRPFTTDIMNEKGEENCEKSQSKLAEIEEKIVVATTTTGIKSKAIRTTRKRKMNENIEKNATPQTRSSIETNGEDDEDHEKSPPKMTKKHDNSSENIQDTDNLQQKTVKKINTRARAGTIKKGSVTEKSTNDENSMTKNTRGRRQRRGNDDNDNEKKISEEQDDNKSTTTTTTTTITTNTSNLLVNTESISNESEIQNKRTTRRRK